VSAGSSSGKKTIAVAVAPSPTGVAFRPGKLLNLVVFLPGKVTAESFTSIVVHVTGTSHVPGEPPDTHIFYSEVHSDIGRGEKDAGVRQDFSSDGERWVVQIKLPERTNCACHVFGHGVPVASSSLDPDVRSIHF